MRFFDLHCDTITKCQEDDRDLLNNDFHISLSKGFKYWPWIQCFAIFIPDKVRGNQACRLFEDCFHKFKEEIRKNSDVILNCKNLTDLEECKLSKKCGAILTVEGGAVLNGDIDRLKYLNECGVKVITLTWNGKCDIGDGVGVNNANGITEFGKKVIEKMNELDIIVDVSHASDKLFYDVASLSKKPFIATHSNSRTICEHERNLNDEQFKVIKSIGGIVGINLCKSFLSKNEKVEMDDIYKHIEYFLSLGGENVISIGADFDGADIPECVHDIEGIEKIFEYLLMHNYSEKLLDKIFFNNAFEFFKRNVF